MKRPFDHGRHVDEAQVHAIVVDEFDRVKDGDADEPQEVGAAFTFEFLPTADDEPVLLGGIDCHRATFLRSEEMNGPIVGGLRGGCNEKRSSKPNGRMATSPKRGRGYCQTVA